MALILIALFVLIGAAMAYFKSSEYPKPATPVPTEY
jgi:hypothetical protein